MPCGKSALAPLVLFSCLGVAFAFPARAQPGSAIKLEEAGEAEEVHVLKNGVLEAHIRIAQGILQPVVLHNQVTGSRLPAPAYAFRAEMEGESLSSHDFQVKDVKVTRLEPEPKASQLSLAAEGWGISLQLAAPNWQATWAAELRDDSNYIKVSLRLRGGRLMKLCLLSGMLKGGRTAGKVDGVPVVSEDFFLGMEHPMAENAVEAEQYRCCLQLRQAEHVRETQGSLVLGVSMPGQMRRSFLHYLERERAHPARRMLHYNTWYDIGTGHTFSAKDAASRLTDIATELGKRGVVLDAFLLDDGWDDPSRGPWEEHAGFSGPKLDSLQEASRRYNTPLGVWFSPFGGYHEPRQRRIAAARRAGLPVREEVKERKAASWGLRCSEASPCSEGEGKCHSNQDCKDHLECWHTSSNVSPPGVDLSKIPGPNAYVCFDPNVRSAYLGLGIHEYYQHLRETVLTWLKRGSKLLKLDGIGNPAGMGESLQEDFDSAMSLIAELRQVSSDIFINLSTGTWPSPFWLLHSDTVWRKGHDHYFEGEGPARERWVTYRDAMVYRNIVRESPLFPLNSLMIHGIIFAQSAWDLTSVEGAGTGLSNQPFKHEVRSAFGSGVMLQELYVTPSLLNSENWDDLARSARWAARRVDTLKDVQWFGGDPAKGEVYGWAAWHDVTGAAILTLRNPSASYQSVDLEPERLFDLPAYAEGRLLLNTPFEDQRPRQISLMKGERTGLHMPPFSVLVFDTAEPAPSPMDVYMDILWDNLPAIFWTSALALGAWLFREAKPKPARAVPAVSVEELRRRRLQALDRRS